MVFKESMQKSDIIWGIKSHEIRIFGTFSIHDNIFFRKLYCYQIKSKYFFYYIRRETRKISNKL